MTDAREPQADVLSTLACFEIAALLGTLLVSAWAIPVLSPDHRLSPVPVIGGYLFIFLSQRIHGETFRDLGFRVDNFFKAAKLLVLLMLAATFVVLAIGWSAGSLRMPPTSGFGAPLLLPVESVAWALIQQYALQGFVNRRAELIWGRGLVSCLAVAIVFAVFHLPNVWLSVATFIGGLVWAAVYQRYPNLWALAISHSIMTFVLIATVPERALQGLRVGIRVWLP